VARLVAERLGLLYLDTGAMYRAVTWKGIQEKLSFDDETALTALASRMSLEVEPWPSNSQGYRVLVEGMDITEELHSTPVNEKVSRVAAMGGVRRVLVERQKAIARAGGIVMAGRDIGTVVLSDAEIKIYLKASAEERARRRHLEFEEKGTPVAYEKVLHNVQERDHIDSTRAVSPLRPADDSVEVDSTDLSIEEVVSEILRIAREKTGDG
jgi:cytidylate kinase